MQTAIVLISSDLRASATGRTAIHPGFWADPLLSSTLSYLLFYSQPSSCCCPVLRPPPTPFLCCCWGSRGNLTNYWAECCRSRALLLLSTRFLQMWKDKEAPQVEGLAVFCQFLLFPVDVLQTLYLWPIRAGRIRQHAVELATSTYLLSSLASITIWRCVQKASHLHADQSAYGLIYLQLAPYTQVCTDS